MFQLDKRIFNGIKTTLNEKKEMSTIQLHVNLVKKLITYNQLCKQVFLIKIYR